MDKNACALAQYKRQHYLQNKEKYLKRSAERRKANSAEIAEYQKNYAAKNRAKLRLIKDAWIANNPDTNKKCKRDYVKRNPGKINAKTKAYKLRKARRTPPWLTQTHYKEIEQFYIEAQELRWLSEEPLEVDHIVPLNGKNVSGLHVPWNLQILPKSINSKKRNK